MARYNGDTASVPADFYRDPLETAAAHLRGETVWSQFEDENGIIRPAKSESRPVQLKIEDLGSLAAKAAIDVKDSAQPGLNGPEMV